MLTLGKRIFCNILADDQQRYSVQMYLIGSRNRTVENAAALERSLVGLGIAIHHLLAELESIGCFSLSKRGLDVAYVQSTIEPAGYNVKHMTPICTSILNIDTRFTVAVSALKCAIDRQA